MIPRIIARLLVGSLGILGLTWGLWTFPAFWREGGLIRIADRIQRGDIFNPAAIATFPSLLGELEGLPRTPTADAAEVMIQLRTLEENIAQGNRLAIDKQMVELQELVFLALQSAPTDAYLWLVQYWLSNARDGFNASHLASLRLSYEYGPNEGWIAVKRNRLVVAMLTQLPDDLRAAALREFAGLVRSKLLSEAADILTGPGQFNQERLLQQLEGVPLDIRYEFARLLTRRGYTLLVPGVPRAEPRPWYRS
jgi:hypothetical protein